MINVKFESIKSIDDGFRLYFTSYLRPDFVEKSIVITLKVNFIISDIYISSYNYGSVEWINGIGLAECREWETEEQAESPGYLTRRYTSRISDGYAPAGHAEKLLIPDVINSIENTEITVLLKSVLRVKKSKKKLIPAKYGFSIK